MQEQWVYASCRCLLLRRWLAAARGLLCVDPLFYHPVLHVCAHTCTHMCAHVMSRNVWAPRTSARVAPTRAYIDMHAQDVHAHTIASPGEACVRARPGTSVAWASQGLAMHVLYQHVACLHLAVPLGSATGGCPPDVTARWMHKVLHVHVTCTAGALVAGLQ